MQQQHQTPRINTSALHSLSVSRSSANVLLGVARIKEVLDHEAVELGVLIAVNPANEFGAFAAKHGPNDELQTAFHLHPHAQIATPWASLLSTWPQKRE
jgi:hypothetical protein